MTDEQWATFFRICTGILGRGERRDWASDSWCAWTTFGALQTQVHYWTAGLPGEADIGTTGTNDRGPWGQPFLYQDLAHIVIPRKFLWERSEDRNYQNGEKSQDIDRLSEELSRAAIKHRKTELMLEIKLY